MNVKSLKQEIVETLGIKDPYGVEVVPEVYSDSVLIRFYYIDGHVFYHYIDIQISLHNRGNVYDIIGNAYMQLVNIVNTIVNFRCLDHITQHIGGHPLRGKVRF